MSTDSVMPSNHLIPSCLFASSVSFCLQSFRASGSFPMSRVFSHESALGMRWPKYWSFSFSISPSSEYSGLISTVTCTHPIQTPNVVRTHQGCLAEILPLFPIKCHPPVGKRAFFPLQSPPAFEGARNQVTESTDAPSLGELIVFFFVKLEATGFFQTAERIDGG